MPSSVRNAETITISPEKGPSKPKPRAPSQWNVEDVINWFIRHCGERGVKYSDHFRQNNISGRTLLRLNNCDLERMGISDSTDREEIWREIIKLKLKSDVLDLRNLEASTSSSRMTSKK